MTAPLKVLFVAAEAAPLVKIGGLGDVAGALPPALRSDGHDVRVVLPLYRRIDRAAHGISNTGVTFEVLGQTGERLQIGLWQTRLGNVPCYLLDEPRYLDRSEVYGYPDDLDRFTVFSRAALQTAHVLGFQPDIVHANDWHTALLPAWLALGRDGGDVFSRARGVLTIHNLAFQGWFDERYRRRWDLVPAWATAEQVDGVSLESMMALGLRHADAITAVSPTYAQEILTPEFGERLDPLLRARVSRLRGILNGIDVDAFNPETDPAISPNYSAGTLGLKAEVKAALQHEAGLPVRPNVPVIGLVTRLTEQKGLDIVIPALEALVHETDTQVIMIGSGDRSLEAAFSDFARRHSSLISVVLGYDAAYAQRIYAGADMFLMPSRFEPCGIGQLIALRYGTVPVVRATGGLIDTVFDWQDEHRGNGFLFKMFSAEALLLALSRALEIYKLRSLWRGIQERGMSADHSWSRSAGQYVEVYRRLTSELPPEPADNRHAPTRTRRRA